MPNWKIQYEDADEGEYRLCTINPSQKDAEGEASPWVGFDDAACLILEEAGKDVYYFAVFADPEDGPPFVFRVEKAKQVGTAELEAVPPDEE